MHKQLKRAVCQLDNQLQNTLQEVSALITKKIKAQEKDHGHKQLNNQRKTLKNKERKWFKIITKDLWIVYKRERNRCNTMLKFKRDTHCSH